MYINNIFKLECPEGCEEWYKILYLDIIFNLFV